ncbi:hypothetical protein K439DRAFT_1618334 [Ramaria rubella]|nr:hypothetical protein K439DRAFT_1618334 [Ramaria rubella]
MQELDPGDGEEDLVECTDEAQWPPAKVKHNGNDDIALGRTYALAKHPTYPCVPVSTLIQDFHMVDFLPAMTAFLKCTLPQCTFPLNEHSRFNVYKRVPFQLRSIQQIEATMTKDIVRASRGVPHRGRIAETPSHFDMVLVHYTPDAQETGAKGYRATRVCAIFNLLDHYDYPHPLAYIEWYTPFHEPVNTVERYQVTPARGRGNTTVIHVDSIRWSCYLILVFGTKVDQALSSQDALD